MKRTLLYPVETVFRTPPLNYTEIQQPAAPFLLPEERLEAVYGCELGNALVSPYGMVMKHGRVVPESVYSMFGKNRNALTFYKKMALGRVRHVPGNCLVAHNAYYDNYYHWTLEAMPRLFMVRKMAPQFTLLIHEKTPRFVDEYLSFFQFQDVVRMKDSELVKAQNLYLPMHTARGLAHRPALVRELGAWLRARAGAKTVAPGRKLFVSREKARYRRAVNEEEVFRAFAGLGYEKVCLEDATVGDQIRLFAQAHQVAGIHGAGFSNLLFAENATLLTDIIHRDHPQDAFYNLACATGAGYVRLECPGTGTQTYCGTDDIRVSAEAMEKIMNYIKPC